jgi:hypothetical protein
MDKYITYELGGVSAVRVKTAICATVFIFIFSLSAICNDVEIKLISPIGAVARSVIPGWGQFYTHDKLQGVAIFLSVGILGGLGIQTDAQYRDYYYNKYRPAVFSGSSQAASYFSKSNDYYKLSRFMLYTAAGIWAYGIIDAYVDAHIYNARKQSEMINVNSERLQTIK